MFLILSFEIRDLNGSFHLATHPVPFKGRAIWLEKKEGVFLRTDGPS